MQFKSDRKGADLQALAELYSFLWKNIRNRHKERAFCALFTQKKEEFKWQ